MFEQQRKHLRGGRLQLAFAAAAVLPFAVVAADVQQAAAQAAAPASRVLGTVKAVSGETMTVQTDAGATMTVSIGDATRVQQLAPGSTDLKTAAPSTSDAIAVGDRVLASGTTSDGGVLTASRVVLMKSAAIAQRNQSTQQDWTRRGMGGLVTASDPAAKTVTLTSGNHRVVVTTTSATLYRRYAPGSVRFEDAKPSSFDDIRPGDQLRVRGDKSPDGGAITADEIVTGTFKSLAGTITAVDSSANTLVIKDLDSKKNQTVAIGPESDLRSMPPEIAARFAASKSRPSREPAGATATAPPPQGGTGVSRSGAARPAGATSSDLSQVIARLPKTSLADLKPGEALMIVASGSGGAGPYTAITVLSGVEALLTGPAGSELTIPPWSGEGGGGEGAATE